MKFFIYQLIHTPTNVCWYAGSTDDMEERWREHKSWVLSSKKPSLIHRMIRQNSIENIEMKLVDEIEVEGDDQYPFERLYLEQCWTNILSPKYNEKRSYTPEWMKKEKKKQWYEENGETYRKDHNEDIVKYRANNREYYNELKRQQSSCCCGSNYAYSGKSRHLKTKKHQEWLKNSIITNNGRL